MRRRPKPNTQLLRFLAAVCSLGGCASPSSDPHTAASPAVRRIQLEGELAISELKLQQAQRNILRTLSDECDKSMKILTEHRNAGRIDDLLWLVIQTTRRDVQDSIGSARAASDRGNSSEVIRLQGYILEQNQELEALGRRLSGTDLGIDPTGQQAVG